MASDSELLSIPLLLNLSAAFDTTDHSIILQSLENTTGIKGTIRLPYVMLNW